MGEGEQRPSLGERVNTMERGIRESFDVREEKEGLALMLAELLLPGSGAKRVEFEVRDGAQQKSITIHLLE